MILYSRGMSSHTFIRVDTGPAQAILGLWRTRAFDNAWWGWDRSIARGDTWIINEMRFQIIVAKSIRQCFESFILYIVLLKILYHIIQMGNRSNRGVWNLICLFRGFNSLNSICLLLHFNFLSFLSFHIIFAWLGLFLKDSNIFLITFSMSV